MTVDLAPISGEVADLTEDEAHPITSRIREWVRAFPVGDVERAFRGRVWLALGYESWAEWCDCELGGFKLPAPQRREVVAELAGQGMSNTAIAEVTGVNEITVRRDLATSTNVEVDRKTLGQDGKERRQPKRKPQPKPKPVAPQPEPKPKPEPVVEPKTMPKPGRYCLLPHDVFIDTDRCECGEQPEHRWQDCDWEPVERYYGDTICETEDCLQEIIYTFRYLTAETRSEVVDMLREALALLEGISE